MNISKRVTHRRSLFFLLYIIIIIIIIYFLITSPTRGYILQTQKLIGLKLLDDFDDHFFSAAQKLNKKLFFF